MNDLKNGDNCAWWLLLLVLPFVVGIVSAAWKGVLVR
jgi:hypothetical protein